MLLIFNVSKERRIIFVMHYIRLACKGILCAPFHGVINSYGINLSATFSWTLDSHWDSIMLNNISAHVVKQIKLPSTMFYDLNERWDIGHPFLFLQFFQSLKINAITTILYTVYYRRCLSIAQKYKLNYLTIKY